MATDLTNLLERLIEAEIEFVLVGGLAAVLHGAATATFDVDVVVAPSEANTERLADLLTEINARYRGHPNQALRPTAEHLRSSGHQLLVTDLGALDVLGSLQGGIKYDDLEGCTVNFDLEGRTVRTLDLPTLIELKRRLGRPKDLLALPALEMILKRGS